MEDIKYRFTLIGRPGTREVFPKNGNTLLVNWEKPENRALFSKTPKGKLVFDGSDFHWLNSIENSGYRCEPVTLIVEKKCSGEFDEFIVCSLYLNSGDWDLDQCIVSLEPKVEDVYVCYEDNKDLEFNLLANVASDEEVNLLEGEIEVQECDGSLIMPIDPEWCGAGDPYSDGWTLQRYVQHNEPGDPGEPSVPTSFEATWIREVIVSVTDPGFPWISIGGDNYARQPAMYNIRIFNTDLDSGYEYQYGGTIDNGMKLQDIFEFLLSNVCSELTLRSNFFRWNPGDEYDNDNNYVTGTLSKVQNLILLQKSDVKRPGVSADATIGNITFEKLLNDICKIFNLKWDIMENEFIIEHVSFFTKSVGMDLVSRPDAWKRAGTRKYSYDVNNMPRKETFMMADDKYQTGDFKGLPIIYSGACVGKGEKETKDWIVENIMTDVQFALQNPENDSQAVSDDGFVLIACNADNGMYTVAPVISGSNILNNTLSWARLHLDYWRYERVLSKFTMNGTAQTALSIIPTKKQVKINVDMCCEEFDPEELIHTLLGDGAVSEAIFDLYKENLSLVLLYNAEEDLEINDPPVAVTDEATTWVNLTIDMDVLANDTDPDGEIIPSTLEIISGGSHGTSSIVDGKIRYIPTPGYIGDDVVTYTVKDFFGETSNVGVVNIEIRPGSPLPIASDDSFNALENTELTVGDVLDNDTGDGTLECVPETKATDQGGTVEIFANGSFTYMPPVDFVGNDGFDYTLIDGNSNTDEGHVELVVAERFDVYVRYSEEDETEEPIMENCDGVVTSLGIKTLVHQYIRFYSDSLGTVPLDVTGYGLIIKMRLTRTGSGAMVSDFDRPVTGLDYNETDVIIDWNYIGCLADGFPPSHYSDAYSILTSPDYTIL